MWFLFALLLAQPAPAEIVDKMQKFYERTQDFKGEFRQVQTDKVFGRKRVYDGSVKFKKPGKMRWDYKSPEKKLFVSDGKTLWLYEPEDNQAFKQSLTESALPTAVTFLSGQGKLDKEFDVTAAEAGDAEAEAGDYTIKLTPKAPTAQYKYILLVVDPKHSHVKQSVIHETERKSNRLSFNKVELNTKMAD